MPHTVKSLDMLGEGYEDAVYDWRNTLETRVCNKSVSVYLNWEIINMQLRAIVVITIQISTNCMDFLSENKSAFKSTIMSKSVPTAANDSPDLHYSLDCDDISLSDIITPTQSNSNSPCLDFSFNCDGLSLSDIVTPVQSCSNSPHLVSASPHSDSVSLSYTPIATSVRAPSLDLKCS